MMRSARITAMEKSRERTRINAAGFLLRNLIWEQRRQWHTHQYLGIFIEWRMTDHWKMSERIAQYSEKFNAKYRTWRRDSFSCRDAPTNPRIAASSSDELSASTCRPRIIFTSACTPPWRIVSRCDVSKNKFRWCAACGGGLSIHRHYAIRSALHRDREMTGRRKRISFTIES